VRPRRHRALLRGPSTSPLAAMRKVTATALAIGAFIAGGLLGYVFSRQLFRISLAPYQMANIDHMATYVMIQRFQGTPQAYETALRDFLVALDAQDRAGPGLFSQNLTVVDRAMTYARLALIAAERNDPSSAAKYRSQAEALCPQIGWKSCSADEITRVVRLVDDRSMWKAPQPTSDHGS
jgi:hypothetical protein